MTDTAPQETPDTQLDAEVFGTQPDPADPSYNADPDDQAGANDHPPPPT